MLIRRDLLLLLWCLPFYSQAQTPQWIWDAPANAANDRGEQTVFFRKTFRTPPLLWNARLTFSADDAGEVFLNGVAVASCSQWDQPIRAEVSVRLNQGENVIGVRTRNASGPAGLLLVLGLGGETNVVTDGSWLVSNREEPGWSNLVFNASHWRSATVLGPQGISPWGDLLQKATATAPETLAVPPGFKVELLRSSEPGEGSWICSTFDDRGRLIISPEGDQRPLLRLTFEAGRVARVEPIPAPIRYAMGLLYTDGTLLANARGPAGPGLYRLRDANRNDQFDPGEVQFLMRFDGGSEHGYHALRLGPDGRLYVVNGNGTKLPAELAPSSPYRHYAHDVLSLNPDESAAPAATAVQGYILRMKTDGSQCELWAGGLRNVYAFDFSPEGELFAFDSDMEWDWGTPWYRPTRILHGVSGGDYGWRDDTRTWPSDYEDGLPATAEIGIGSPTGVRFGATSRFPERYRQALFAMDWSYGRILAVHLEPNGASFRATWEPFLHGSPLNLTDLNFGPDGALYFITGGRATQSGLYRVSYTGQAHTEPSTDYALAADRRAEEARLLRRRLEGYHGRNDPAAINVIWPCLGNHDRFLRYAARIALESQPLERWRDRALTDPDCATALTSLLALARLGGPETQPALIGALGRFPLDALSDQEKLWKLRVLEVSLVRQGKVRGEAFDLLRELNEHYPALTWPLNRELSRLLIYLQAANVVPKTLDLLAAAPSQEEQLHYVAQLRRLQTGWTLADRKRYFQWWLKPRQGSQPSAQMAQWFADVGRSYVDGAWLNRYLREFRADAIASLSPQERQELASLLDKPFEPARSVPVEARPFVREWTMTDLQAELSRGVSGRNFERGRQAFAAAQCLACHRFGNDGGSVGPELNGAGQKYDLRSLLESILEPSKVVAEPYQNLTLLKKDGESITGRLVRQTDNELVVETAPLSSARETVRRSDLERVAPSSVSPMPEGLLNTFTREEILDLLAYLQSGGQADAPAFREGAVGNTNSVH